MIRCVLVATDGSEAACAAVRTAAELVASLGPQARLHVAAAIDYVGLPGVLGKRPPGAPDLLADQAREALDEAAAVAKEAGASAEAHVLEGDVVDSVLGLAAQIGADLLAIGFQGRSRLARLVMGSVAGRLVHSTHLPVVVVRAPEPEEAQ